MVSAQSRSVRGWRASPPARGFAHTAFVGLIALAASAHAGSDDRADPTEHVLVGLTPEQAFQVTCEDSALFTEPLTSDALGLLVFETTAEEVPSGATICVMPPGPPRIDGEHTCDAADSSAAICWRTDRPSTSQVEYGTSPAYGNLTPLSTALVREHEVEIGPLEAETTYHYRVISVDVYGNSSLSEDRTLTTLPSRPRVFGVTVVDVAPELFTVAWSTSGPCDARVEYGTDETYGSTTPLLQELRTEHQVTVDGLLPHTTYHFRVWSADQHGQAVSSADNTVETPVPPLEILAASVEGASPSTITIRWSTNEPADSQVEYGTDGGYGSATDVDPEFTKSHLVTVDDLDHGTAYHLRAISADAYGSVALSGDLVAVTLDLDVAELGIPTYAVADTTSTTATLLWETTNPAICHVEYGESASCGLSTPESATPEIRHALALSGLSPRTLYYFRIHARDAHGQRAVSSTGSFTTKAQNTPGGLTIAWVIVTDIGASRATIAWQTNTESNSTVEYGTTEAFEHSVSCDDLVTTHVLILTGLLDNTAYCYRVRSAVGTDQEAVSDAATFRTLEAGDFMPPAVPDGLKANPCVGGVSLSWDANAEGDLAAYRIYRRAEGETMLRELIDLSEDETLYVDRDVRAGRIYDYAVSAVDLAGNESSPCDPVRVGAGLDGTAKVWVFPNPIREGTTIRFAAPTGGTTRDGHRPAYTATIYDARGRVVRRVAGGRMSADVESVYWDATDEGDRHVASGVYFCVVSFAHDSVRTKLMVVR